MSALDDDDIYADVMVGLNMNGVVMTTNGVENSLIELHVAVVNSHAQSSEPMISAVSRLYGDESFSPVPKYVCDECRRESQDRAGWVVEREASLCPTCWSEPEDDDDGDDGVIVVWRLT